MTATVSRTFDAEVLVEALTQIAATPGRDNHCERYTGQWSCRTDPSKSIGAKYAADRWCNACIAQHALDRRAAVPRMPSTEIEWITRADWGRDHERHSDAHPYLLAHDEGDSLNCQLNYACGVDGARLGTVIGDGTVNNTFVPFYLFTISENDHEIACEECAEEMARLLNATLPSERVLSSPTDKVIAQLRATRALHTGWHTCEAANPPVHTDFEADSDDGLEACPAYQALTAALVALGAGA